MDRPATPRRRREGLDAIEAALDEQDIRDRIDEPDESVRRPGDYRLDGVDRVAGPTRHAAEADVYTPDEALLDLAGGVGREVVDDDLEDDYRES